MKVKSEEKKVFRGYSDFFLAEELLTEEDARKELLETLRSFRGIDGRFLSSASEEAFFTFEKSYIPVYRLSGDAEYLWGGKGAVEHRERRPLECVRFRAPKEIKAGEWNKEAVSPVKEAEIPSPIFSDGMIPFKENERELRRTAADYSPDSAARIALDNRRYEVFFIPVLQATSHYEGKSYVSLINLNNGACVAAYPVSEKVTAGIDRAKAALKTSELCIAFAALFILTFGIFSLSEALKTGSSVPWAAVAAIFALELLPAFCFFRCSARKKADLERRAGENGKSPGIFFAVAFGVLSWIGALFAAVVFGLAVL